MARIYLVEKWFLSIFERALTLGGEWKEHITQITDHGMFSIDIVQQYWNEIVSVQGVLIATVSKIWM